MNHEMSLNPVAFEQIKSGQKTIEARLFDKKRQLLALANTITFTKLPEKDETINVEILGLSRFRSFNDMFSALGIIQFGWTESESLESAVTGMQKYYSSEEENKFGVLGIHIKII